jgi:hypothetical protein
MNNTTKQYFIKDIATNKYYCNFPDGYSSDLLDAVSFDTKEQAENRVDEIIKNGRCLVIIEAFVASN